MDPISVDWNERGLDPISVEASWCMWESRLLLAVAAAAASGSFGGNSYTTAIAPWLPTSIPSLFSLGLLGFYSILVLWLHLLCGPSFGCRTISSTEHLT